MKSCFHKGVCKHLVVLGDNPEGPCAIIEACKFYVGMDWSELKKPRGGGLDKKPKRHYKKRSKSAPDDEDNVDISEPKITEKTFKKAMNKINRMRFHKKLTENQLAALEPMKGKHFKTLTEEQKQQIRDIAQGK